MSGNCCSLLTAAASKKDKGKNQAKVGRQKNKGDCDGLLHIKKLDHVY